MNFAECRTTVVIPGERHGIALSTLSATRRLKSRIRGRFSKQVNNFPTLTRTGIPRPLTCIRLVFASQTKFEPLEEKYVQSKLSTSGSSVKRLCGPIHVLAERK